MAVVLISGCGGHGNNAGVSKQAVAVSRPARAVWCPTSRIIPEDSKPNTPTEDSFDTRSLLGQTESKAAAETDRHGCSWRIVIRDGHGLPFTADARPDRVDATINHGIVTAVGVY